MEEAHNILLIECEDQPGIVAAVASFIAERGGNILHADQHTDLDSRRFYMRVQWQRLDGLQELTAAADFVPLARRFGMRWSLFRSDERVRAAILVSKQDHCAWDLLLRQRAGELQCDFQLMISNHDTLRSVARHFDVPFHHVPVDKEKKDEAEKRMLALLDEHQVELVVLARYMQILSSKVVEAHQNRIINVHHSFLPAFVGAKPYHQAHRRGVKLIGATAHYVTSDLDEGPIIEQEVQRTTHRDRVTDLIRKGKDLEKVTLARAVRLHCAHRVLVVGNRTVVLD